MVVCLERGADLHVVQLMPLPLTVSCFSKIQIGFTFLVLAHLGSPGQRAVKRVCVCSPYFPYGLYSVCMRRGGIMVRELDSRLKSLRVRPPRPFSSRLTTLGKLFTHVRFLRSSVIWYQ